MGNVEIIGPAFATPTSIPLYTSRVSAGFPSPAQDHMEDPINIVDLLDLNTPQLYMARALGDSMIGVGIFDGDLMFVNRALDATHGAVVVACLNGEALVKRFIRDGSQIILKSENPKYPPRFVMENDELEAWGVVKGNLRMNYG